MFLVYQAYMPLKGKKTWDHKIYADEKLAWDRARWMGEVSSYIWLVATHQVTEIGDE